MKKIAVFASGSGTDFQSIIDANEREQFCVIKYLVASKPEIGAISRAEKHGIKLTEFLPEYAKYKRGAPLKRNEQIIDYADMILAFWDGKSKGTKFVIEKARAAGKDVRVIVIE